jgi:hypothetical protein
MNIDRNYDMRFHRRRCLLIGAAALVGAVPMVSSADIVTDWSAIATTAVVKSGAGAVDFAIVHVAVYDAVNAIERRYETYRIDPSSPTRGASSKAAAAAAAYYTLVGLFPDEAAALDAAYGASLESIPDGLAKTKGIAVGEEVAAGILQLRANDGRNVVVPYVFGSGPGVYEQTPLPYPPTGPIGTSLPGVTPLVMQSPWQFRAYGPPDLTSWRYTRDLEEVHAYGSVDSTVRSGVQGEIARFHTENPNQFWGRNLGAFVASLNLDTPKTARLMALLTVAAADATIACFDSKYTYNFWRPVTAIHQAGTDDNPATEADPSWTTWLPTPPHPEYPAAHGCIGGAVAQTFRKFFGTRRIKFTFSSTVTGTTHVYNTTDDLTKEIVNARVHGGMHFRSSVNQGVAIGRVVAKYVADNAFESIGHH